MRVTAREHDLCLAACARIRQDIAAGRCTEQDAALDLTMLNIVAGAYACAEPVSRKQWLNAREIAGF